MDMWFASVERLQPRWKNTPICPPRKTPTDPPVTGPFTIYYLGYPQTTAHANDLVKFGHDTCANLQHTLGLLELYHIHGTESGSSTSSTDPPYPSTGNEPPHLGFGHLGFTVPDVPAALRRLRAEGVRVIKDVGPGTSTREAIPLSKWEEERGIGLGEVHSEYAKVFDNFAFVADPDGYTVELVAQAVDPLA
jgi:lactoylglutathione lyase